MPSERTLLAERPRVDPAPVPTDDLPGGAPPSGELDDRSRPRWARPALISLLVLTAAAYLYNLSASGYGNDFYAAAVQAGTKSWKAFLFGSIDSSNFITVDKPPAALWVMELSARIFGFNTWSVMVPNVAEGVASVALLHAAVRRTAGSAAGLAAAAVLAATPVAALMFRFDNPDAFLVLLLVAAAYCVVRALEAGATRWVVAAGALLGFAFLAKMLQAFTVVPAFGLVYLLAAPVSLRQRLTRLAAGTAALVLAAGWWVAVVALVPAADRPFVDGSPDNSILNLIFVYNGFGRLTGSGGAGSNFSGAAGVARLFNDAMGGQASWLLPAALVATVAALVARRGAPRTDKIRAGVLLWGGWLVVTGAVFSYGRGVIHTYYTVALAPAIAALVAIGARHLWARRHHVAARATAAAAVLLTGVWAYVLLDRTPSWDPWLRIAIVAAAVAAAAGLLAAPALGRLGATTVLALVLVAGLGGPVAYAADTIDSAHTGSIPTAGPAGSATTGGFGGGIPGGSGGGARPSGAAGAAPAGAGRAGRGFGGPGAGTTRKGAAPAGVAVGGSAPGGAPTGTGPGGASTGGAAPGGSGAAPARTRAFGSGSGPGAAATTSAALVKALESDASHYRWVAATSGSQSAATLELATGGDPVMAIGGFNGQGGNLSLAAFETYVRDGAIHYYVAGQGTGGPGGGGSTSAITTWVAAHFKAETIGGLTVYDLGARLA